MINRAEQEVAAFNAALDLPASGRAAYLDEACAGDQAMRARVEAMLGIHERMGGFLEMPVSGGDLARTALCSLGRPSVEKPGDRIGRYILLEQIGEGGCGVVYMAEQEHPVRRKVALKVIKLGMDTKNVIARFEAERQALALMEHPNIAKVLDAGATETGRPYFVMELVRGTKITDYCDENKVSTKERLRLFVGICQTIQHAHQKGIIHRDIKPSNVLVTVNNGVAAPMVIDFGIAKATEGKLTDKTLYTGFEQFLGTPAYMSPEQSVMTSLDIDTRSDIYSLGVLLYELLTGKTPFDAKELLASGLDEMRRTIQEKEPQRPSTRLTNMGAEALTRTALHRHTDAPKLVRLVQGDLDWIVMKALEKDRTRRYQTANGLAVDMQRHLDNEPVTARPPSSLYKFQKLVRRNTLAVAAAAVAAFFLIGGLGICTLLLFREKELRRGEAVLLRRAEASEDKARVEADRSQAATVEARTALADSDFSQAAHLIAEGDRCDALAYLSRILSGNPANEAALTRLTTLLTYHSWMVPALVLSNSGALVSAKFSPAGDLLATASGSGAACVWDARSGRLVAKLLGDHGTMDLVDSLDFSPDGKRLATAFFDQTARVWDAQSGRPATRPLAHSGPVWTAQFSPDGKWIATASKDGKAWIWDAQEGRLVSGPLPHDGSVVSAQFSPDGRRVVTASYDNKARVWDAPSGRLLATLAGHDNWVNEARFSPDGNSIVTASYDGTARVWDADSGQPLTPPSRHRDRVRCVQFSPDGKWFATGSFDNTARVWSAQTGLPRTEPLKHDKAVRTVQFSPDGKRVLTASWDETARVWDAESGLPLTESMRHASALASAQFSPDGGRIVTACADGTAQVWDSQSRNALSEILNHRALVAMAQFSPDGSRVVTASFDGTARLWEVETGRPLGEPMLHGGKVRCAQFSPDGKKVVTASDDKTARIWDVRTGRPLTDPLRHSAAVLDAEFSPDGQRIVTVSDDHGACIWDAQSGRRLVELSVRGVWQNRARFSPDGTRVVTAGTDNALRVWDARTGKLLFRQIHSLDLALHGKSNAGSRSDGPTGLALAEFSPDGKSIVTASFDHTARVWDAQTGRPRTGIMKHDNAVLYAQFSPDGKRIVTASWDQKARIWDAATGQSLIEPINHRGGLSLAQFSPDGKRVVTASDDDSGCVWDAQTGLPLTEPLMHRDRVFWAQFSPDGRRVVTASRDGTARIWDVAPAPTRCPEWLLPLAEAIAGRVLDKHGILEETKLDRAATLRQIRERLNRETEVDDWVAWGRWFLADPFERTISPFSRTTVREYIEQRIQENTPDSLDEAERLAEGKGELLARISRLKALLAQKLEHERTDTNP